MESSNNTERENNGLLDLSTSALMELSDFANFDFLNNDYTPGKKQPNQEMCTGKDDSIIDKDNIKLMDTESVSGSSNAIVNTNSDKILYDTNVIKKSLSDNKHVPVENLKKSTSLIQMDKKPLVLSSNTIISKPELKRPAQNNINSDKKRKTIETSEPSLRKNDFTTTSVEEKMSCIIDSKVVSFTQRISNLESLCLEHEYSNSLFKLANEDILEKFRIFEESNANLLETVVLLKKTNEDLLFRIQLLEKSNIPNLDATRTSFEY